MLNLTHDTASVVCLMSPYKVPAGAAALRLGTTTVS